jgi:membrane-bound ClpP family serine protease
MRFSVPQFIDVEDKIFGQLTLSQGVYLAGAAGGAYMLYAFFGLLIAFLVGIPLVILAVFFAFIKVNNRPFTAIASAWFFYIVKKKLYLWRRTPKVKKVVKEEVVTTHDAHLAAPKLTESKLRALAFSLDTQDSEHEGGTLKGTL